MMNKIIRFSRLLRENGIPASIRSTKIAYKAAFLVKKDKKFLREALASVYLKNHRQRKKFDELFDSIFEKKDDELKKPDSSQPKKSSSKFGLLKGYRLLVNTDNNPSNLKTKDKDSDFYKMDHIKNVLQADAKNSKKIKNSYLLKSDINTLNSLQPELLDLCQKLGKKIATKRTRRYKQSKGLKPDVKKTIRKNLKYGGVLVELVKNKPKIKKTNHFFLSDVSASCDWISSWFFCMVYAAKSSFNKARVFEFDNKTVEITFALNEPTLFDAFIRVLEVRQENSMIRGTSNMYTAFQSFLKQVNLNNKSYVMILSDCRDWAGPKSDGKPMSADLIENISRKSKRVLVFNPEPKKKWNVVDSCVSYYEDFGAEFFEVRNLEQLANLISEI